MSRPFTHRQAEASASQRGELDEISGSPDGPAEIVLDDDLLVRTIHEVGKTGATVADVRRWLAAVDAQGIPDAARLSNEVHLYVSHPQSR
jgi:hypothetical protein